MITCTNSHEECCIYISSQHYSSYANRSLNKSGPGTPVNSNKCKDPCSLCTKTNYQQVQTSCWADCSQTSMGCLPPMALESSLNCFNQQVSEATVASMNLKSDILPWTVYPFCRDQQTASTCCCLCTNRLLFSWIQSTHASLDAGPARCCQSFHMHQ